MNNPLTQIVNCPNCGKPAERSYLHGSNLIKTSCGYCDYLLVNNTEGGVIESYAPGLKTKVCA